MENKKLVVGNKTLVADNKILSALVEELTISLKAANGLIEAMGSISSVDAEYAEFCKGAILSMVRSAITNATNYTTKKSIKGE